MISGALENLNFNPNLIIKFRLDYFQMFYIYDDGLILIFLILLKKILEPDLIKHILYLNFHLTIMIHIEVFYFYQWSFNIHFSRV